MFEEQFKIYLRRNISISNEDFELCLKFFEQKEVSKGTLLLDYNSSSSNQYFILSGITCSFILDDFGNEKTIQISTENSWTGDLNGYTYGKLSEKKILCISDCKVLVLAKENWEKLLIDIPAFERLFRILFQKAYVEQTKRVEILQTADAKNRYLLFCRKFPELVARVELRFIASFLNIKPETLSRIRKSLN
ncbi:MAG TPA: hypothetical protein VFR70_02355 [Flavobacterium sp.]|nr:hypothetical protein [Flavobacterium sp.]